MDTADLLALADCAGLSHNALSELLAEEIPLNLRTAQRYVSGKNPIPEWMGEKIIQIFNALAEEYIITSDEIKVKLSEIE